MINYEEIKQYLKTQPTAKAYIGVDSERFIKDGKPHAKYHKVIVVHAFGGNGGRVFGETLVEPDYDIKSKPSFRLMTEVYKASELYLDLAREVPDIEIEVHLDLNPNIQHKSSKVVQQAIGYIRGSCGVDPVVKPSSWAASHVADHFPKLR